MYTYLNTRDADSSLRNARQLTDAIIFYQTWQKQTWRRGRNLKTIQKVQSKRLVFKPVTEMLAKNPETS